jgi:hypothetical protein
LVQLYKALGGGWEQTFPEEPATGRSRQPNCKDQSTQATHIQTIERSDIILTGAAH